MKNILLISNQNLLKKTICKIVNSEFSSIKIFNESQNYIDALEICKYKKIDVVFSDLLTTNEEIINFKKVIKEINNTILYIIVFKFELEQFDVMKIGLNNIILRPISVKDIKEKLINTTTEMYKEKYGAKINKINSLICKGDFLNSYEVIKKELIDVYNTGTIMQMKDKTFILGQNIITSSNTYSQKRIKELLYADSLMDISKEGALVWVFEILDYYFNAKSVDKYPILENVFVYISENLEKNISLKDVVDICAISQGYLSRLFKFEYNLTVLEYIHLKKINLAKRIFIEEDISATEVAFRLGYNERGYFSKVFKKYEGSTIEEFKFKLRG